jgi:hypothetical protein
VTTGWTKSWVRLEGAYTLSPFICGLSDKAFRVHFSVLCTRAANRGDLYVPDVIAEHEAKLVSRRNWRRLIDELVEVGPWDRMGGGGYSIDPDGVSIGQEGARRALIDPVVRESIYERDGYRCLMCGATESLSLDHVIPWSTGGDESYQNLRTLCISCNSRRGAARFNDETLRNRSENG